MSIPSEQEAAAVFAKEMGALSDAEAERFQAEVTAVTGTAESTGGSGDLAVIVHGGMASLERDSPTAKVWDAYAGMVKAALLAESRRQSDELAREVEMIEYLRDTRQFDLLGELLDDGDSDPSSDGPA